MFKRAKGLLVQSTKDVLGGETVFYGTRVPVRTLIDYLKAGDRLDDFLHDYPSVKKDQAVGFLERTKKVLAKG